MAGPGDIDQVTDHVAQAVSMLDQYEQEQHPNEVGVLEELATRVQGLEDVFWDLYEQRFLDGATGVSLDRWGVLLAEPRDGLTDTEYRQILRAVLLARNSDGSNDRLARIAKIAGAAIQVRTFDFWPPTVRVEFGRSFAQGALGVDAARRVVRLLRRAKMGGVKLQVVEWRAQFAFGFAGNLDSVAGFGKGKFARRIDVL